MSATLHSDDIMAVAEDAFVFGFPLMLMDITRNMMTAVSNGSDKSAPVNQFLHLREVLTTSLFGLARPNMDTLFSSAWLDLKQEPLILNVPATQNRYCVMHMLDLWTNIFPCPGTRTTGNNSGIIAFTGPDWNGALPQGIQEIKCPTNSAWLIGRIQTNGKDDYPAVHALQDQYRLTPLGAFTHESHTAVRPVNDRPVDLRLPPLEQVTAMDVASFFGRMNTLMVDNPPASVDERVMKRFATIGIGPGKAFNRQTLGEVGAEALRRGMLAGQAKIAIEAREPQRRQINGWDVLYDVGRYQTNYLFRAVIALTALGSNLPEDTLCPRASKDFNGQPLIGSHRYVIRFTQDQLPPVDGFWSITAYNAKQLLEPNSLNRHAISNRNALRFEDDGALMLYIQNQSPGADKESNWLPPPIGFFSLLLRLYSPKHEVLNGTWKPPAIKRIAEGAGTRAA